ncbi:MAG: DUF2064 domain-containing protein [Bacteroidota bacterium]
MSANAAHIALLFFSRSARAEQLAKPFGPEGERVHEALIDHSHKAALKSGLKTFWLDEADQVGDTFGERLANAYESLFSKGFSKVIAIGNDCPNLSAVDIQQAASILEKKDWVLGPAADGGLYLLGLTQDTYDREDFLALDWEQASLLSSLEAQINQGQHTSIRLDLKVDIDGQADLVRCLSAWGSLNPLYYLLAFLVLPLAERSSEKPWQYDPFVFAPESLRAPPVNA